ncbi:MAG: hypothetical protein S4CHLAM20_05250 [Chlamydiia bacterium]|nr:hypothetical protein [Chlamydiia bacterium]
MQISNVTPLIGNEAIPTTAETRNPDENSVIEQATQSLVNHDDFRDCIRIINNANVALNVAQNDVSRNKKLITKRVIAIIGISLSTVLALTCISLLIASPPLVTMICLGVGFLAGGCGAASFAFWSYSLFKDQSLNPDATSNLEKAHEDLNSAKNSLKNIIRVQNENSNPEFHERLLNISLRHA